MNNTVIPHDETAEQCILGAILMDNRLLADAAESLSPDAFYLPFHKRVFEAMLDLFAANEKVDAITLNSKLGGDVTGASRIASMVHGVPAFDNIDQYIKLLIDKMRLRELIKVCTATVNEAMAAKTTADDLIEKAEQEIFSLGSVKAADEASRVDVLYDESMAKTEKIISEGIDTSGIKTGLIDLDRITGGWKNSDLIILAARPGMGKTAAMIQFAMNGISDDRVGVIFSLEMSKEQLMARMIANEARIDVADYMSGRMVDRYFNAAKDSWVKFKDKNLYIDNPAKASPMQILAKCRRLHARHKRLDFVCIDYLQLLSASGKQKSRYDTVSDISRELKQIAMELNVPVLALSQLSRATEERRPPIPILKDLRESGSIEQDADLVVFIYREEYYNPNDTNMSEANFIVAKHRNGPCNTAKSTFFKSFTRFENLAQDGHYGY